MNKYFLLFISLLFVNNSFCQSRTYDIILFGDTIGELISTKLKISDSEYILSYVSNAEATVFFVETKSYINNKLIFKNNFVSESKVYRKKNDDVADFICNWNGNYYDIIFNNEKKIEKEKIYFCATNFFFDEPIQIYKVYIERLQKFTVIEHLGNHIYMTKLAGATNTYTYKNGVLQSVKSKKGISIYTILRD